MPPNPRQFSPAADRNKDPILTVLRRLLPARATVLEIAAGTGQHAAHFAAQQPEWSWLPSDGDPASLPSIAAWCAGLANVRPPFVLDLLAGDGDWSGVPDALDAIWCANLLHISPWATCDALMRGAARHLAPDGVLVTYGPYLVDGETTAPSNLAFDADLKRRNAAWGLRRLADVAAAAARAGLRLDERVPMPANNLVLAFRRRVGRAPSA